MNDRTTIALVFVAVALACATIFFERDVSTTPYQSPDRYNVLRGLKSDNVDRIVLVAGNQSVILKRGGSRWLFERPLGDRYLVKWEADADAVNRLVELLETMREAAPAKIGTPGDPLDLVADGLQNANERIEVDYGSQRGPISATLALGRTEDRDGGRQLRFVRVNKEERILVIENTIEQIMRLVREGGNEFRSRTVFARDDLAETDEISILRDEKYAAELARVSNDIWEARWAKGAGSKTATSVRCSDKPAKNIATAMQALRVERFIADTSAQEDFQRYGLMKPQAVITLTLRADDGGMMAIFSGPQSANLRVGRAADDAPDEVYAMAQKLPMIFTIKKSFLDKLPKDPAEELPDPRLVNFESSTVSAIALKNGGGTLRAEKNNFDWNVIAPLEIEGDDGVIAKLLDAVTTNDCDDVVWRDGKDLSEFGLRNPLATLRLTYEEERAGKKSKRVERIQFGKTFEKDVEVTKKPDPKEKGTDAKKPEKTFEKKKFVYVRRAGDTAMRVFPYEKMKAAFDSPMSFFKRRALDFSAFEANKLRFERTDGTWSFEKRKNDWWATTPVALKADQGNVGGIVSAMSWLTAAKIVSVDPADLPKYGLDKPQYRFDVELKPEEKKPDAAAKKADAGKDGKSDEKPAAPKPPRVYRLIVAKKTENGEDAWYGHVPNGPTIFTLEKDFTDRLEAELINTDVFPFQWSMKEATVEHAGAVTRLSRDADGKVFKVADGKDGSFGPAEAEKGRVFFDKLAAVRVDGRYITYDAADASQYGFGKEPFARITALDKADATTVVEFGGVPDEAKRGKGLRFGRIAGQSAIFVVKQENLDAILKPASDYRPAPATPKPGAKSVNPGAGTPVSGPPESAKDPAPEPPKEPAQPKRKKSPEKE